MYIICGFFPLCPYSIHKKNYFISVVFKMDINMFKNKIKYIKETI